MFIPKPDGIITYNDRLISLTRKLNAKTLYKYLLIESNSILKIIHSDPLEFIAGVQGWFNIRKICQ